MMRLKKRQAVFTRNPVVFPEVKILKTPCYPDERGFFTERFRESPNFPHFVQVNHSFSKKGVIRGMHFQSSPGQAKCVFLVQGKILDVFVDIRPNSSTFGQYGSVVLDAALQNQVLIPSHFAHGFAALEDAHVVYLVSSFYDAHTERTFSYADPEVGIEWPFDNPLVSDRDREAKPLKEVIR